MKQKKGTWANYLAVLEKQKKDWTDPTYLMQAYGITEKASLQIIARRQDDIDEQAEREEWERHEREWTQ